MDKIVRAFAISIVIFAIIIGYVVSSRIDQTTISVLSGTIIGIITAAPFAAILTLVILRKRDNNYTTSYERQMRTSAPLPQNPPQYWTLPQQTGGINSSAYGQQRQPALAAPTQWQTNNEASPQVIRPRRRFYVIGENGEPRMVDEEISEQAATNERFVMGGGDSGAAF